MTELKTIKFEQEFERIDALYQFLIENTDFIQEHVDSDKTDHGLIDDSVLKPPISIATKYTYQSNYVINKVKNLIKQTFDL